MTLSSAPCSIARKINRAILFLAKNHERRVRWNFADFVHQAQDSFIVALGVGGTQIEQNNVGRSRAHRVNWSNCHWLTVAGSEVFAQRSSDGVSESRILCEEANPDHLLVQRSDLLAADQQFTQPYPSLSRPCLGIRAGFQSV